MARVPETIGATIRRLRERLGLTRKEFAPFLGVSDQHLYKIETGRRNPTLAQLYRLLERLPEARAELRGALELPETPVPLQEGAVSGELPGDVLPVVEKHEGYIVVYTKPEWEGKGITPEEFARVVSAIYMAFQRHGLRPEPEPGQ